MMRNAWRLCEGRRTGNNGFKHHHANICDNDEAVIFFPLANSFTLRCVIFNVIVCHKNTRWLQLPGESLYL
jgi:hypothetical protein